MMNSIIGSSSIRQNGLDLDHHLQQQATASVGEEDEIISWAPPPRLGTYYSDDDKRSNDEENYYNYNKRFCFKYYDVPVRNLAVKMQHAHGLSGNIIKAKQPLATDSNGNKWYKELPPGEMLPRNEALGGYIFVCNNETMQDDLRHQLFGLPQKYKDSVRAITPGLPLFLYNYTSHQLHGVFRAVSFGGSNIDPTAWEDKKCKGESRFPAQVRIRIKKKCKALEEDAFRPILYHYDGPKFRLQLSVPEALALLDLFKEEDL